MAYTIPYLSLMTNCASIYSLYNACQWTNVSQAVDNLSPFWHLYSRQVTSALPCKEQTHESQTPLSAEKTRHQGGTPSLLCATLSIHSVIAVVTDIQCLPMNSSCSPFSTSSIVTSRLAQLARSRFTACHTTSETLTLSRTLCDRKDQGLHR